MLKTRFVPIALSGVLFASPLVLAEEEAHHPEQDAPAEEASQDVAAPGGMMMGGPEMMGKGGMMGKGMMGGMQGKEGSPGGMMMGRGMGRGGMMRQGMKGGHGGMKGHGGGHRMMGKHQQVLNRLDLLEARLVKIEAMLERLMQR